MAVTCEAADANETGFEMALGVVGARSHVGWTLDLGHTSAMPWAHCTWPHFLMDMAYDYKNLH